MGINQIKHKKLNIISKVKHNFIENIFIYQINTLIYEIYLFYIILIH